jgi:RHS repeat-associated protein
LNKVGVNSGASSQFTYDNANQLQTGTFKDTSGTVNTVTYQYDGNGNQVGRNSTQLSYDQGNHLTDYGASHYTYDGDGLRQSKTTAGTATQQTWSHSGGLPLLVQDGSTSYVSGPNGLPVEQVNSDGSTLYYHQDQLGSTRALTDGSGSVDGSWQFDAYGNTVSSSVPSHPNPFLFAGQYQDSESGLYYLRARFYDPSLGQFIARDPVATVTRQPYSYVGDNPTNLTDPTGLFCRWLQGTGSLDLGLLNPLVSQALGGEMGSCSLNSNGLAGLQSGGTFQAITHSYVPGSAVSNGTDQFALGGFAGLGASVGFSNADWPRQLAEISDSWNINLAIGGAQFSVSIGGVGHTYVNPSGGPPTRDFIWAVSGSYKVGGGYGVSVTHQTSDMPWFHW